MEIFVPANNKGGVGKTATATMFAEYSTKILNKKVLLMDLDPQVNLSQRYLPMEIDPIYTDGFMPPIHPDYDPSDPDDDDWDGRSSTADIFLGIGVIPYPTYIKGLDIIPGHANKLLTAEHVRKNEVVEKVHVRVHEFLSLEAVNSAYDLVIIDTAPSKGPLTISAIKAATHMVIPTVMEDKPTQGIYGMLQLWKQECLNRDEGRTLELVGILPNMFNSQTSLHNGIYESLAQHEFIGKYLMDTKIGDRVIFAETDSSTASPKSIFDLNDSNKAKMEALSACEKMAERVFG